MPPKTKITRDMILDAAFAITCESGIEAVNARSISQRLGCSTQPVMYVFAKVEDIKKALYAKADQLHSEYMMHIEDPAEIMLNIGLNYIRFAVNEPNLFRFLFQSGYTPESSVLAMVDSEELAPMLGIMQEAMGMDPAQTKMVFVSIAVFAHGYASIIANNSLEYDETLVASHLDRAYRGAVLAVMEESGAKEP